MLELQGKKLESKRVEQSVAVANLLADTRVNKIVQTRREQLKTGWASHAVFIFRAGLPLQPGSYM